MRCKVAATFILCASAAHAQGINFSLAEFSERFGGKWQQNEIELTEDTLDKYMEGVELRQPDIARRFRTALEQRYQNAVVFSAFSKSNPVSLAWLESQGDIVLLRLFVNTVHPQANALFSAPQDFELWFSEVNGAPLTTSISALTSEVWEGYLDPTKRVLSHGWVDASGIDNRAMAWGVPPDFIEITVTTRPDCEFAPVPEWLVRQLCP
ncbi:hypothetical protein [Tateyamaria sp. SN3-11]|uniref:hypothetical protein n=1 Tax=Tateyamaria sp. SN3-11 TaxID=3092147 RepID=UPI0039E8649F